MSKLLKAGFVASSLLLAAGASAYEAGDVLVRVGATSVQPDDGAEPDNVWVEDNTQLGANFTYMATNNIGVELLVATPFEHDIELKTVGTVGSTKHLPPTLSAQYYFNNSSVVTPYVGLGLNYTIFFDENLDEAAAAGVVPDDNLELKNSFGLAYQVGMDIAINDTWGVNIDIRKIDIETEIENGPLKGTEVEVNPMVYSLTALYKF